MRSSIQPCSRLDRRGAKTPTKNRTIKSRTKMGRRTRTGLWLPAGRARTLLCTRQTARRSQHGRLRQMGRRSLALLLCLAVALLAGCGSQRDQEAAQVAARFYSAVAAKDGAAACSQLSEDALAKLESEEKASCPKAVLDLDLGLPAGRERSTHVYLTSAK